MKTKAKWIGVLWVSAALFGAIFPTWAGSVQLGTVKFIANTNVKMFKFTGEVKDMSAQVQFAGNEIPRSLKSLMVRIPVNSIKTGMDIRDLHMRERVFTAADGSTPDVIYEATQAQCQSGASPSEQICKVNGQLTLRGQKRDLPVTLTLSSGTDVSGTVTIDVLQFGVTPEQLSYSGIKVDPAVELDFKVQVQ